MKNYIFQVNNFKRVVTASNDFYTAYNLIKNLYPNSLVFLVKII
jgi:hypothetical protein